MFNLNAELENGSQSADLPYYIASIYAIRGNRDQAIRWLQKAETMNWADYAMLEFGPYFMSYRKDAGIISIVQRLKSNAERLRQRSANR